MRKLLLWAGLVAAAGIGYWAMRAGDRVRIQICRDKYLAAHSLTDTAAVDLYRPLLGRRDAVDPVACGTLRQLKRL